MPMRACVCTACLVSVAGGVGCPGDPRAGGETRGPALMVEPRAGCAAAWASPFRAACETSAHKSFGDSCLLGRAGGCPGWACGLCLPCLVGRKGMGKKICLTLPGPGGGLSLGPWPGGPCAVMKFSKSSAVETLLPVFEGLRLGHLRLASCVSSAVATWGGRYSG